MSVTAQNLTLLTDLYELTMMQGYFKNPVQETVIFDAFYRVNSLRKWICDRSRTGSGDRLYQKSAFFR